MPFVEAVAALLILANSWLLIRRSVWNFAFGIAGVAIYGWVFWTSRLYSDALLQVFFVIIQLYGWYHWARGKAAMGEVVVDRLHNGARLAWVAGIAVAILGWGGMMQRYTDNAAPWPDATVAIVSVAAQILLTRRKVENWVLWIVVNVVSILLYASGDLHITMALYCVMLMLSVWGLVAWRRAELTPSTAARAAA